MSVPDHVRDKVRVVADGWVQEASGRREREGRFWMLLTPAGAEREKFGSQWMLKVYCPWRRPDGG